MAPYSRLKSQACGFGRVNWKAKVYIMQKSGSGAKTKWTSVINGSSVKKTKPSMSDLKAGGCATTNNVIAQYIYHKDSSTTLEVNQSAVYESIPEAYAELKEGSIYNETFEAMAGVPSTRSLYFATGGSEFIVNMQAIYDDYYLKDVANATKDTYRSKRRYKTRFNGVDCEYKKGDTLKTLGAGETKTETFVADVNDKKQEKSVTAEKNNAVNPTGASSYNTTVKAHTSATKFEATWTGTIANNTPEPEDEGKYTAGKPGNPCPGSGFTPGTQRTKKDAKTKWDVSSYNDAVKNAFQWAKDMEKPIRMVRSSGSMILMAISVLIRLVMQRSILRLPEDQRITTSSVVIQRTCPLKHMHTTVPGQLTQNLNPMTAASLEAATAIPKVR